MFINKQKIIESYNIYCHQEYTLDNNRKLIICVTQNILKLQGYINTVYKGFRIQSLQRAKRRKRINFKYMCDVLLNPDTGIATVRTVSTLSILTNVI